MNTITTYTSMHQIPTNELPSGTDYVFDLDQTLIDSVTHLGSGPFFYNLRAVFKILLDKNYQFKTEALVKKLHIFVLKNIVYKAEEGVAHFIDKLQDHSFTSGLTARTKKVFNTNVAELTHQQLLSVGINLEKSSPSYEDESNDPLFKRVNGVYFTDEKYEKGPYLVELYKNKRPSYVVFGDDIDKNSQSVANSMAELNIPCHAFEYRPYLNNIENNGFRPFNLPAATVQLDKLIHDKILMDDHEAAGLAVPITSGLKALMDLIVKIDDELFYNKIDLGV